MLHLFLDVLKMDLNNIQNQLRALTIMSQNNRYNVEHSRLSDKIQAGSCTFYVDTVNNVFIIDSTLGIENPIHIDPFERELSNVSKINGIDFIDFVRKLEGENGIEVNRVIGQESGKWIVKINNEFFEQLNGYEKRVKFIEDEYRMKDDLSYHLDVAIEDKLALESWVQARIDEIPQPDLSIYREKDDRVWSETDNLALESWVQAKIDEIPGTDLTDYRKKADLVYKYTVSVEKIGERDYYIRPRDKNIKIIGECEDRDTKEWLAFETGEFQEDSGNNRWVSRLPIGGSFKFLIWHPSEQMYVLNGNGDGRTCRLRNISADYITPKEDDKLALEGYVNNEVSNLNEEISRVDQSISLIMTNYRQKSDLKYGESDSLVLNSRLKKYRMITDLEYPVYTFLDTGTRLTVTVIDEMECIVEPRTYAEIRISFDGMEVTFYVYDLDETEFHARDVFSQYYIRWKTTKEFYLFDRYLPVTDYTISYSDIKERQEGMDYLALKSDIKKLSDQVEVLKNEITELKNRGG